jgi:hypothetical protein
VGINLQLTGMSCVGAGPATCVSVFLNGQILETTTQSNGSSSSPTILANTPTQLNDISCPTLSTCTAVGGGVGRQDLGDIGRSDRRQLLDVVIRKVVRREQP